MFSRGNRQVEKFFKDDVNRHMSCCQHKDLHMRTRHFVTQEDFLLFQGNRPVEKFLKDDIEQRASLTQIRNEKGGEEAYSTKDIPPPINPIHLVRSSERAGFKIFIPRVLYRVRSVCSDSDFSKCYCSLCIGYGGDVSLITPRGYATSPK
ncbi:hypothetical protein NQ317_001032 [Molorchus minor]|uniref:Uncharacterized protein n=1 Tax=Molorchus minor TaxID=1323400 RepID=A0ABQ9JF10_9CUCU|nr:hypothetical protein NQ317_001032 [Molorchus minor]